MELFKHTKGQHYANYVKSYHVTNTLFSANLIIKTKTIFSYPMIGTIQRCIDIVNFDW